jgi:hypothetical protein
MPKPAIPTEIAYATALSMPTLQDRRVANASSSLLVKMLQRVKPSALYSRSMYERCMMVGFLFPSSTIFTEFGPVVPRTVPVLALVLGERAQGDGVGARAS